MSKQFGLSDDQKFDALAREVARKREEAMAEAKRKGAFLGSLIEDWRKKVLTEESAAQSLADRLNHNAAPEIAGMIERCERRLE